MRCPCGCEMQKREGNCGEMMQNYTCWYSMYEGLDIGYRLCIKKKRLRMLENFSMSIQKKTNLL